MKNIKLISVLLAVFMLAAILFTACEGNGDGTTAASPDTTLAPETAETPVDTTEAPVDTTEAPVDTTEAPVETTKEPEVTTAPETDPPHTHSFGAWTTVKEPACTAEGTSERSCSCGEKETQSIAATGHSFGAWATVKEPGCTEAGSSERSCACGEKETQSIAATGHSFGAFNTVKAASCTEEGLAEKVCACGAKETQSIEKIAHRAGEWVVDKEATANAEGSKHQPCAVCGAVLKTEAIPKTPHIPGEWITEKEPTCTEAGSKYRVCTKCGEKCDTESIPAMGHIEVIDAAKDPTCTEKGLTEGKHCSVCNAVTVAQNDIPAKGHIEVIDAAKEPTCTEKGLTEGKHCSVCDAVITAQNDIPAKGHTEVTDAGKAATCTEKGITEGKHCSVCNTVITAQKEIPAKGHTGGEWITDKAPTTTSTGSKHQVCSVCGATVKTETIPMVEPTKIDYTVTVVDGAGNPLSGIQVTFMSPMAPVGSVKTDEDGRAVCKLVEGSYDAEVDAGDDYYAGGVVKLTASAPAAEVVLVAYAKDPKMQYPDAVNGVYSVNVGSVRVPVEKDVIRYFFFKPAEGAVYKIYTDSDKVDVSYHGGDFNVLSYNIGKYDEEGKLVIEFLKSSVGQTLVIGLTSKSASVEECTLTVVRFADMEITVAERPYEQYQAKIPTKKTETPKGSQKFVEISALAGAMNEIKVVYNEADGYYHLNTADGPVLYVVIAQKTPYQEPLWTIAGTTGIGHIFYDENGNFVKKEGYNEAIAGVKNELGEVIKNGYAHMADAKYGAVPLDADLIHILKHLGEGDWYYKAPVGKPSTYIFGDTIVRPENCWLFPVCYFI